MSRYVPNKDAVRKAALSSIEDLEKRFAKNVQELCEEIDEHIKALTPVHTGEAVRNYIWTSGTPFTGRYDAIETGETGRTNSMALGTEPRRPENESAARQTLLSLDFHNPFQTFYLTNNAPSIMGLELGLLPGPPLKSRSPNGMFGLTQAFITAKIAAKGFLR